MEKQPSFNWRMDKENVVHYTMEYYSAVKNNDIMKFKGKWIELKKLILHKVTQTQKDKHGMFIYRVKDNHAIIHRPRETK